MDHFHVGSTSSFFLLIPAQFLRRLLSTSQKQLGNEITDGRGKGSGELHWVPAEVPTQQGRQCWRNHTFLKRVTHGFRSVTLYVAIQNLFRFIFSLSLPQFPVLHLRFVEPASHNSSWAQCSNSKQTALNPPYISALPSFPRRVSF